MEHVVEKILDQWGFAGAILIGLGYLIYLLIKNNRGKTKGIDRIENSITDLSEKVDDKFELVGERINNLNKKVDYNFDQTNFKFKMIEKSLVSQSKSIVDDIKIAKRHDYETHREEFMKQFENASKYHKIINSYIKRVKCDHMFVGYFHNGGSSISGIPFCKFDIIAEKFKPEYNKTYVELVPLYKDVNLFNHGDLPNYLAQNESIYYKIDGKTHSELEDIDDILYRRLVGRKIKQLGIQLLFDKDKIPFGFIGFIDYDIEDIDFEEFKNCAKEIEKVHES